MKHLILERFLYGPQAVLGELKLGKITLFSVERPWLFNKIGVSCIPCGLYQVAPHVSPSKGNCYKIAEVPGRLHILIHSANFSYQLQGCIALGSSYDLSEEHTGYLNNSREAMAIFDRFVEGEEFTLEIRRKE
jgi:hypothetical protein